MQNQTETKIIHDKTFDVIKSAVDKMVNFIRPTFGPASNKVLISKNTHRMIVDDGVQIARDFELSDPAENAVVSIIREVAVKTNDRVGDGTTSSLIMLQAIISEVARKGNYDGRKIEKELLKGLDDVRTHLKKNAHEIKTKEDLKKVSMISFDNEKVSEMISDLYWKLGKDGVITIDKSPTMDTTSEISEGIKIDRGYISPYMIINPERMESVLEKPSILITDYRLTEANDIIPIMNKMAAANKRDLVVICENMEQSALATAVLNKIQGKFFVLAVCSPSSDDSKVTLEDIALLTGAKMFTESKGDKLENAEIADLGHATRFICRQNESVIVGPKGKRSDIAVAITSLRSNFEHEKDEKKKESIKKRLGMFTQSVAVIKVGAPTENEQKALKYKVEDAVNSTRAAFQGGIVCGAGVALSKIRTSSPILNEALQYPHRQLMDNMGIKDPEKMSENLDDGHVMNVVTGKVGPYLSVGVVDPVDVLIAGVESAVSIASILVTTSGMVVEHVAKSPIVNG